MFMLMPCKRCGKKILMKNMRLAQNGVDMICIDCISKETQLRSPTMAQKLAAATPAKKAPKEPMVKWYCQDCKYHFDRKQTATVDRCPYCGKIGTVIPETKLASDKIIEDSTSGKFDF